MSIQHPPFLTTIGKPGVVVDPVTKVKTRFEVIDEVTQIQSDFPGKVIILQKVKFIDNGKIELRLGYYIIGKKPGMLGKWTWGQYAAFMPLEDFVQIVAKAQAKGWF